MSEFILVYVSVASSAEAEKIAQILLDERLIACVNLVDSVSSFFHWEGKNECSKECLLIMKTRTNLFAILEKRIKILHSYDVPEIIAVPIILGSEKYFDWMKSVLKG